jgi:hypothetical protein
MTVDQLCAQLDALGVKIGVVDGKLRIDAPSGALSDGLRAGLVEHKTALLCRYAVNAVCAVTCESIAEKRDNGIPNGTERFRIPLTFDCPPSAWAAARGLRIVGGNPDAGGQPVLYLADLAGGRSDM